MLYSPKLTEPHINLSLPLNRSCIILWNSFQEICHRTNGSFTVHCKPAQSGKKVILPRLLFASRLAVRSTAYCVLTRDDPIRYFNPLLTAINQIHYMNTP